MRRRNMSKSFWFSTVTPKVHQFVFLGTAKPGNNVRTTCFLAEGDTPVTFSWLRNGVDASLTKNVNIQSHTDYSVLTVNPVDASSAGNFTCIAKNRAGFDSYTAYLDVEAPPEWKQGPQDTGGTLGSELALHCSVTGSPTPRIAWYKIEVKNGRQQVEIELQTRMKIHPNGTLVFVHLDIQDTGQYTCEADNGVNPSIKKTVTVRVNGRHNTSSACSSVRVCQPCHTIPNLCTSNVVDDRYVAPYVHVQNISRDAILAAREGTLGAFTGPLEHRSTFVI